MKPEFAKILALACRAAIAVNVLSIREAGAEITSARRDELLAKCAAGEYVEVELDMLAYEQDAESQNRNFVRFRDGAMLELGRTGRGTPFLRDHEQGNSLAKGGTIIESSTEKRGEGSYAIRQTVKLTAPWAVDLALRGLLSTVSVGWNPLGPVLCSACNAAIGTKCYHYPGARLAEVVGDDGAKRLVRKADGPIVVQWVFTKAELVETSAVPVPAVPGAHIEGIRAALATHLGSHFSADESEAMDPDLLKRLGLAATAGVDEIIKAVDSLKTRLTLVENQRDEATNKLVAIEAKLAAHEQAAAKAAEDAFISEAVKAGKVIPSSKFETSLRAYYGTDPEGAKALIASTLAVTPVGAPPQRGNDGKEPVDPTTALGRSKAYVEKSGVDYEQAKKYALAFGAKDPDKAIAKHVAGEEI